MSETRSVEVSGADIEEAIELGLEQLQVSRESVIVEIIEEPSKGFLGVGAKDATVRLTTAARPRSQLALTPVDEQDGIISLPQTDEIDEAEIPQELIVGREKLQALLEAMGIDADVTVEQSVGDGEDDDAYILQVRGEQLNALIGRKGQTLASLQYITRLIASRDLQRRARFVVDVGEYKAQRAIKLYQLANRMANQAVERGRTVKLEPMPPHERRIVHMALRRRGDVTTNSVGEGRMRKVTIIPQR